MKGLQLLIILMLTFVVGSYSQNRVAQKAIPGKAVEINAGFPSSAESQKLADILYDAWENKRTFSVIAYHNGREGQLTRVTYKVISLPRSGWVVTTEWSAVCPSGFPRCNSKRRSSKQVFDTVQKVSSDMAMRPFYLVLKNSKSNSTDVI